MSDQFDITRSLWAVTRLMQHAPEYRRAAMEEFRPTPASDVDLFISSLCAEWGRRGRSSW